MNRLHPCKSDQGRATLAELLALVERDFPDALPEELSIEVDWCCGHSSDKCQIHYIAVGRPLVVGGRDRPWGVKQKP